MSIHLHSPRQETARDDLADAPTEEIVELATKSSRTRSPGVDDWLTAAVVFGILGGCMALWVFDLSLIVGALAAMFSGLAGVLFAEA